MNNGSPYHWLTTGDDFYDAIRAEIGKAHESIRLEMYIYMAGQPGNAIRAALRAAVQRGIQVKVLLDAFGSYELPSDYWAPVISAGGKVWFFNPLTLGRMAFRNHRKLLVCDGKTAFVSGFNISSDELGDGVARGWRDLGLKITGPVARELSSSFDRMSSMADFRHPRLARIPLRRKSRQCPPGKPCPVVLTSGPGQTGSAIKRPLLHDLKHAKTIRIISAYFLPTYRIRRTLAKAARNGRDIKIITSGQTDVRLARFAGRALYNRLLNAGIQIFEYQPQILHSKLIIADDVVYVGSANLDARSLNINYELLVRVEDARLSHEAHQIFESHLLHCQKIERRTWPQSRGFWEKMMERFSHFLLARIDPLFARRQLGKLR